eukprot:5806280-Pyramimonas_sp.AAC.2
MSVTMWRTSSTMSCLAVTSIAGSGSVLQVRWAPIQSTSWPRSAFLKASLRPKVRHARMMIAKYLSRCCCKPRAAMIGSST